jgi:phage replication initiation protein
MKSLSEKTPVSGVFCDTLSFTIPYESLLGVSFDISPGEGILKPQLDLKYGDRFLLQLKQWFIKLDCGIQVEEARGFGGRFYSNSCTMVYTSGSDGCRNLGTVYFGGDSNKNTINFLFTGEACDYLNMHGFMRKLYVHLGDYDTKLTRVDLAIDFKKGEYTVTDIHDWHRLGYFNTGGRTPDFSDINFIKGCERTFYVGSRQSAKFFRAYEKGHQLGDMSSKWVRYEMEYKSKNDAVLPLDMLVNCAEYFKSAYPAFEKIDSKFLNEVDPKFIISTVKEKTKIYLDECVSNVRQAYGRVLNVLASLGQTPEQILADLSRSGLPSRLIVPDMEPVLYFPDEISFGESSFGDCPI